MNCPDCSPIYEPPAPDPIIDLRRKVGKLEHEVRELKRSYYALHDAFLRHKQGPTL